MEYITGRAGHAQPDQVTIGARLRILRRWRGLSQEQLAGLAGVSQGYVSLVEKGRRPLDRRSIVSALAAALEVSETDLVGGPHLSRDRVQSDPHLHIPALRVALTTASLDAPAVDGGRPLAELRSLLYGGIEAARRTCDYVRLGDLLPGVIDELYWHAAAAPDGSRQDALRALTDACAQASHLSAALRHMDLAFLAASSARAAAAASGDPLAAGRAAFALLHSRPRAGTWDRNLSLAERAVSELDPYAHDASGLQVLVMLMLTASMSAAALQKEAASADWLDSAAGIAARFPDDPDRNWQSASATNVGLWRVAVAVERGAASREVLALASRVETGKLRSTMSRLADFRADVGKALVREKGTRQLAVEWLAEAERTAPQRIRNSPTAREGVAYLLNSAQRSAGGRELRGMAVRMGIPVLRAGNGTGRYYGCNFPVAGRDYGHFT